MDLLGERKVRPYGRCLSSPKRLSIYGFIGRTRGSPVQAMLVIAQKAVNIWIYWANTGFARTGDAYHRPKGCQYMYLLGEHEVARTGDACHRPEGCQHMDLLGEHEVRPFGRCLSSPRRLSIYGFIGRTQGSPVRAMLVIAQKAVNIWIYWANARFARTGDACHRLEGCQYMDLLGEHEFRPYGRCLSSPRRLSTYGFIGRTQGSPVRAMLVIA